LEKERFTRTKPNSMLFHIIKRIKPNNNKEMKCLITEAEKHTKARPLLSKWRGEREVRSKT
jgi:hypothetical protein